jgi:hypothetical protein
MPEPSGIPAQDHSLSSALNNLASAIRETKESGPKQSNWNSLEITKLLLSSVTPVIGIALGYYVAVTEMQKQAVVNERLAAEQIAKQAEVSQRLQYEQVMLNRRVKSYDTIKDDLNRIHCFILDIGTWKEETPDTVIGYKRAIDREMSENKDIWSPKTVSAYEAYMNAAFAPYQGAGKDAAIKTSADQKDANSKWRRTWDSRLTGTVDLEYRKAYDDLSQSFLADITR